MNCFTQLVNSHFLANVFKELQEAQLIVKQIDHEQLPAQFYANPIKRKEVYEDYLYQFYLREEMRERMSDSMDEDFLMVYFLQIEHTIFIYSRSKRQLEEAAKYAYNLNGDIPLYRGRHRFQNKNIHTALFDTRLSFEPISPN